MDVIAQVLVNGIILGSVYASIAVGFNLIWRSGRVFNIALGEMFMAATFIIVTGLAFGLNVWLAALSSLVVMVLVGLAIERGALRRLVGESAFSLLMATLAMLLIIKGGAVLLFGADPQLFPHVLGAERLDIGPVRVRQGRLLGALIVLIMIGSLAAFFRYSRMGLLMTAVAEDHQIARSLGIRIHRSMALSWALCGVTLVVAVITYMGGRNVTPEIAAIAFVALPVVLLAGLETIGGLIPAGIIVGVGQVAASVWLDPFTTGGASLLFPYLLMLVILLVFPHGLFGWRDVERI